MHDVAPPRFLTRGCWFYVSNVIYWKIYFYVSL